ncbi:MAG TPA: hypothetical protein PLF26_10035, partial [Blastocatellia bacterium]|nr:hypothetical protein [Blastocatellia bacterium]
MPFVFSNTFFVLLALGLVPISMAWVGWEFLAVGIIYDAALFAAAGVDVWISERTEALSVDRRHDDRVSLGEQN